MTGLNHNVSPTRAEMVRRQISGRGISNALVLAAMRVVPRETFIADELTEFAYEDSPLPIQAGQTIPQPYVVARIIELAELEPHAILANTAEHRLKALGYDNVTVYHRDGTAGLPEQAPFDAIIVPAGSREVPELLPRSRSPARRCAPRELVRPMLERAIDVIYRPESELASHYFEAETFPFGL